MTLKRAAFKKPHVRVFVLPRGLRRFFPQSLAAALALILLFSGCGAAPAQTARDADSVLIYRLARNPKHESGLVVPEELQLPEGEDKLRFALASVFGGAVSSELVSAFPSGFGMQSFTVAGGEVFVYLGRAYLELTGVDRTAANACLTLTMCSLEGISSVSVYVDGVLAAAGLTPEDTVLTDGETN